MMRLIFTQDIQQFLLEIGYKYCLSKTQSFLASKDDPQVTIILSPVKEKPVLKRLPDEFDTYFHLRREPAIMAAGIDEVQVLLELSETELSLLEHYRKELKEKLLRTKDMDSG